MKESSTKNDSAVRCSKDCHYHYHQHFKLYGQFNIKDYMQSLMIHTILCWKKKIYYMIYSAHAIGTIQEKKSLWEGWLRFLVSQKRIASHEVNFQLNNYLLPEVCPLLSVVLHVSLLTLWYCKFWELWDIIIQGQRKVWRIPSPKN